MVQLVTLEGEVVFASGVVVGGSMGDSVGLLQRKREIRNLEEKIIALSTTLNRDRTTCQTQKEECGVLKQTVQGLDQVIKESEMQVALEEQELTRLTVHLEELGQKIQTIITERQLSQDEQGQLDHEEESTKVLRRQLEEEESEQQHMLERSLSVLDELEEQGTHLQDRLTEARLTLNSYRERLDHHQADLLRFQQEDEARQARLLLLQHRVQELAQHSELSEQEQIRSEVQFQQLDQNKSSVQGELVAVEEQHADSLSQSRELEQTLHGIRKQHSETRERRAGIEVRLAELRTRLQTLEETLGQTYDLSLEDLLAVDLHVDESDEAIDQDDQISQWRERLQNIRTRLERMGPINLAAIDEHRELDERYTFLTKQEQDLSESIHSLQEIIERLNDTTNQKFEETFQALQEKFSEVFSALFAGGKAELVLVKPEGEPEPGEFQEEPGVDIAAQPPGKRLKSLGMLSGGEKTLTVMALMFASFLIRPSPFCILDEVDAPLDETNVVRFARFLTQMSEHSQFVVITHNKQTMEVADSLFGVTMEEPGVSKFVAVRLADLETVG
jgi:chromosome segregation protein